MTLAVTDPDLGGTSTRDLLELADWRRRLAELYADVRRLAAVDPQAAWELWRAVREDLYREHPQSPVPTAERARFRARYYPYDPTYRLTAEIEPPLPDPVARSLAGGPATAQEPARLDLTPEATDRGLALLPASRGEPARYRVLGRLRVPLPTGDSQLTCYWLEGYAGGLFLPFGDATNGRTTYLAGRYLLDAAKGADLGGDPERGRLVLDFNFAYQPSCAFDPRWSCPLPPPTNRLAVEVPVGERIA